MTTRQTCLFRPTAIPAAVLTPADDAPGQGQPTPTIPRFSGQCMLFLLLPQLGNETSLNITEKIITSEFSNS